MPNSPFRLPHLPILLALLILLVSSTARAEWEPEVKLSTTETAAALNENMGHCLLAKGDTLHAVWFDAKDADHAIYYKRSTDKGTSWAPDARLSPTPGTDTNPLLAQSGDTLHLVFLRDAGTPKATSYYKRSTDNGLTWGPDVPLGETKWWPGVAAAGNMVYVSLNTVYPDDAKNSAVYFRRSTDNGTTWNPQQQISLAPRRTGGRSEDPAIMADGKYVHLVWNDNRDSDPGKGMAVYYRRSADMGVTWSAEISLTHTPDYTYFPTLFLTGTHVDVAYGDRQSGHYDVFHLASPDFGATWSPKEQLTTTPDDEFYPIVARDGQNVHMAWSSKKGIMYLHSPDGGTTWKPALNLVNKGTIPFLATSGDALHLIFLSRRDGHPALYYKRNPTGNK